MRYVCPHCKGKLRRQTACYHWRGVLMHGWICDPCNSLWDIGGAFVKYVEKRAKND